MTTSYILTYFFTPISYSACDDKKKLFSFAQEEMRILTFDLCLIKYFLHSSSFYLHFCKAMSDGIILCNWLVFSSFIKIHTHTHLHSSLKQTDIYKLLIHLHTNTYWIFIYIYIYIECPRSSFITNCQSSQLILLLSFKPQRKLHSYIFWSFYMIFCVYFFYSSSSVCKINNPTYTDRRQTK